jgi:hypothetical protein
MGLKFNATMTSLVHQPRKKIAMLPMFRLLIYTFLTLRRSCVADRIDRALRGNRSMDKGSFPFNSNESIFIKDSAQQFLFDGARQDQPMIRVSSEEVLHSKSHVQITQRQLMGTFFDTPIGDWNARNWGVGAAFTYIVLFLLIWCLCRHGGCLRDLVCLWCFCEVCF